MEAKRKEERKSELESDNFTSVAVAQVVPVCDLEQLVRFVLSLRQKEAELESWRGKVAFYEAADWS